MKRPIFPKKGFSRIWLCPTQFHMGFWHYVKVQKKLMIEFQENPWTDKRTGGWIEAILQDTSGCRWWFKNSISLTSFPVCELSKNTPQCQKNCVIIGGLRKQIENIGGGLSIEGWIKPSAHHVTFFSFDNQGKIDFCYLNSRKKVLFLSFYNFSLQ